MTYSCPCCRQSIAPPPLNHYDAFFTCSHCMSKLTHCEDDIVVMGVGIIATMATILLFLGVNQFAALTVALLIYHYVRPSWIEPFFRLRRVY